MRSSRTLREKSVFAAAAALFGLTLLAGCVNFAEESLDRVVYFDNATDQTLYVRNRSQPEVKDEYLRIEPLKTTELRLVSRGACTERVVITDIAGEIVMDPGRVCWHGTVTIP
jgi:hypothetical protein